MKQDQTMGSHMVSHDTYLPPPSLHHHQPQQQQQPSPSPKRRYNTNHDHDPNDDTVKKTGKFGVLANAVNFIGGVSFLGLPFALKESGLIVGLFLIALIAILTEASHRLIMESSKFHVQLQYTKIDTYEDLVAIPFGRMGEYVLMYSVFVVAFGACVEFTVMIKDLVPTLVGDYYSGNTIHIVILTWALFIVPLTLIKDLSSLTFISVISLGLSVFLGAVIIKEAPFRETIQSQGGLWNLTQNYWIRPHIFTTISIFTEVFAWQHGIFQFFNSLRRANIRRWRYVTSRVHFSISIIYIIVCVPAYLGYLDETKGDIFLNLPSEGAGSILTNIARVSFFFICIMTYPLEMLVARDIVRPFFVSSSEHVQATETNRIDSLHPSSGYDSCAWIRQNFVTGKELVIVFVLDLIALLLGILFHDLGVICAVVGALGGSIACFIVPGLVYLGVNGDDFISLINRWIGHDNSLGASIDSDSSHTNAMDAEVQLSNQPKPWWFYACGFPFWCYIAKLGASGVRFKLRETKSFFESDSPMDGDHELLSGSLMDYLEYIDEIEKDKNTLDGKKSSRGKFFVAMILVVFGVVTLIVGLLERI